MKKLLYAAAIILGTTWGLFFIFNHYQKPVLSQGIGSRIQVTEQVILSQEEAQIKAIERASSAIVGVVNLLSEKPQGEGSGVVYRVEAGNTFVVTNEHVVSGGDYFEVVFADGERVEGELIGSDVYTDLAVLKLVGYEAKNIAVFGQTDELRIGQTVIAIGNPLGLTFAGSATSGIVSGHDRTVPIQIGSTQEDWEMTVLQTDTAINPGNSGGALINLNGEVVGINSMKISSTQIEGMSFSIPTYIVKPIIADIEEFGSVVRPILGIQIRDMNTIPDRFKELLGIPVEQRSGIYVDKVLPDSLASRIGIHAEDVIVAIGEIDVENTLAFRKELFKYRTGDEISITVLRGEKKLNLISEIVID